MNINYEYMTGYIPLFAFLAMLLACPSVLLLNMAIRTLRNGNGHFCSVSRCDVGAQLICSFLIIMCSFPAVHSWLVLKIEQMNKTEGIWLVYLDAYLAALIVELLFDKLMSSRSEASIHSSRSQRNHP